VPPGELGVGGNDHGDFGVECLDMVDDLLEALFAVALEDRSQFCESWASKQPYFIAKHTDRSKGRLKVRL
jgi:hypothetical protein